MIKKIINSSLFFVFITLFSCKPNESINTVKISIKTFPGNKALNIKVIAFNILNLVQPQLAETKPNTDSLQFVLTRPTLASLEIAQNRYTIYLEPGYDLNIVLKKNLDEIYFTGKGSEANNYLSEASQLQAKIEQAGNKNIYELDIDGFLARLDSIKIALVNFHQHYIDSIQLSQSIINLFEKRNEIKILSIKQNYGWNYGVQHNFEIPESLNLDGKIPFDSMLLINGVPEYALMLHMYMHLKFYMPLWINRTPEENTDLRNTAPNLVNLKIDENGYPSYIEELLLAKNIDHWMTSFGIVPSVDSVYAKFKNQYPNSSYLFALETRYKKWMSILPGQPAPDFKGIDLEGKKISLSDLKNKVVYIDVWATWCGPCKEEFPFSKKLQKKLASNDQVAFLYVSVDKNQEDWKKMLRGDPDFKGIHIIEIEGNETSIWEAYQISGIPRYVLVDQNGIIVNADAPRPSSDQVEIEIEKLLAKGI